ncbi:MAG TPA: phage protease [Opitutales bacterium]|nr:phage protease [Opitutales bacterium]
MSNILPAIALSPETDGPAGLGTANELAKAPAPGQWLKLAEYGDWPHPSGLQRFTRPAAENMVRGFQSLWGRLRRRFGGVPVYVGHPDDPGFAGQAGHDDTRAYAWVTSLEAREDGLYILPRWSEAGRELLNNAFYKFLSPRWQLRPLGDGAFEPVKLLSIGLTNHPNIPGEAIANQQPTVKGDLLPQLIEALELDPAAAPENLLANAEHLAQAARDTRAAQTESARFYRLATDADAARQAAERRAEAERLARIEVILDAAEWRGQFPPAERPHWREKFQRDFDGAQLALANAQAGAANGRTLPGRLPAAQSTPLTTALAARRPGATRIGDAERFLTLVNERMTRTGEDYATAFARAKREHAVLFEV